jgi:hypothetical protein
VTISHFDKKGIRRRSVIRPDPIQPNSMCLAWKNCSVRRRRERNAIEISVKDRERTMRHDDRKILVNPEPNRQAENTLTKTAGYIISAVLVLGLIDHYLTVAWYWARGLWPF